MFTLLASLALAATPHGDVHASAGVGEAGGVGAMAGGSLGLRVHPRLRATARVDAGLLPAWGPGLAARPELRLTITHPTAIWGRFDLVAGLGLRAGSGVGELGFGGAALEVPGLGATDLRVEGGYLFDHTGLGAVVLSAGPVFDVRRRVEEPEPPPPPPPPPPMVAVAEPEPEPNAIHTELDGVEVWFPHPTCRWVPLAEANAMLASMGATDVQVIAPGRRSQWVRVDGATELALEPLAEVGSLVVITSEGDTVAIGGQAVAVSPDGVLLLSTRPGLVEVEIVGNGRREALELVVAPKMTTWARATPPTALHVTFPADSAVLSPRGIAEIRDIAAAIGDARLTVEGSYSPEGDVERNRALAADRARAGLQALLDAGVPRERIDLVTVPKTIDSTDWRVLRAAVITPSGAAP